MPSWEEWERASLSGLKAKEEKDDECIVCPKCSSQWFESIELQKFLLDHTVVLGQNIPSKAGSIGYKMLRCIRCSNILEPKIIHTIRDIGGSNYSSLLDTLEGKNDTRAKDSNVEKDNEIQSQKF